MGSSQSKPEFVTVLAEKHVKVGQPVTLRCEANTEDFIATWEKKGQKFNCVQDKHEIKQTGKTCSLKIINAQEEDEGFYTLNLTNYAGSVSCSAMVTVELNEWRTVQWNEDPMINKLKTFKTGNDKVRELRFLLLGPVGAGKSSTINTIRTIFERRQFVNCLAAGGMSKSYTIYYEKYSMEKDGQFPFAFNDIMGVEKDEGVLENDIISALKGHIKEGYTFNFMHSLSEGSKYYRENPTLNDKIHCLVNVVPADNLAIIPDKTVKKMKAVRDAASKLGMPQVVFLTKVDDTHQKTQINLRNVYKSKKIRDKMRECSNLLGVPTNCIFPVCNYHEKTGINEDINCLMLDALTQIVDWANDYVVKCSNKQTHVE
ncbi:interferon-induced protein 44-like [Colossoma macropomum]|uniref:interferon-induced protein 44-like n=1 Tax=Colossoma macropomum TaxID=42526 RepID=UPI001864753A|nr:interferon-induced protein 44-like [Colossoma macropomum]